MPVEVGAFSIDTRTLVLCYLFHVVEVGVVDKKTGMSILAVAVHLQMIVIRDTGSIRLHFRQDSSS